MLARIIDWSIGNRFLVLLTTAAIAGAGIFAVSRTPLDAIPDLSDVQVIIYTEYPGQAPRIVEDQITYPLTTQMLGVPFAEVVRGYSFFGFSFVYILFEDGTDLYWARSRVLEYLNSASSRLPSGVTPTLGPDATGVGWAFMYVLKSDRHDLSELRSMQDWYLKYELASVSGVSEIASVGGFVRQYQITLDPNRLRAYGISISQIRQAIQRSNNDVGGRLLEVAEQEFMIRGLGYFESVEDIQQVALGMDERGTPILLRDVARVQIGPEMRRGLADWDGEGEVVGGIVIVRYGADARQVIRDTKTKLEELQAGLPDGVEIEIAYDRSALIGRAVATLQEKLVQQVLIVGLVCFIFLAHFRSGLVAILTLPIGVLIAFVAIYLQGMSINIMSLGGIAVAIGTMVDAGIVMVENAHRRLSQESGQQPHWTIVAEACREVGPAVFLSLLVITVSFVPVFTLEAQEGRLFKPLAFTKTYAMAAAALLSITLVPVLVGCWVRGTLRPPDRNPVNRLLVAIYRPLLGGALRFRWALIPLALLGLALTAVPYGRLGSEFMPPLWEGDLLYMPTTFPGVSATKARELVQQTDRILKTFPEVEHVFGKAGRADTATDPAPLSMIETTVTLKPQSAWRPGMTPDRLVREMNEAIQVPGLTNAWTMPIKTRIDMLSTGIKTPVGVKIAGPDLRTLEDLGQQIEGVVSQVSGTLSVYAERVMGGSYLDFAIDRQAIARYGLTVADVQDVIQSAIGGTNVTTTVEGLERYPVNLRYSRELRDDLPALRSVLVATPSHQQIPLGQLADLQFVVGPPSIKTENARPNAWVFVDIQDVDVGTYVERARVAVAEQVPVPAGYSITWSGQYEYMQRAQERLLYVIPFTLLIIFVIIFINTKSLVETAIVLLGVPFAVTGAIWLLDALDYNTSVAVWVGVIALAGLYAETGMILLLYLDQSHDDYRDRGLLTDRGALIRAIYDGSVKRVRPILMTIATDVVGLLPIMWSQGAGADVMKRIATPLVGGVVTSGMTVLLLYPVAYYFWKSRGLPRLAAR
ncbi:MAG: CusA/CzcA family heavy metal efflux RND transporter [Dehalococcoidia bacterium]|jgi:Cu(I)/Ag(I) efflux system membrane protein CusA/SilA|nr:CusA/CzcA family heavy metal efflux RND transporter [Dehalococcoidia bacterium]